MSDSNTLDSSRDTGTLSIHPESIKYTSTHEWVRVDKDGCIVVGITDHAQEQLGDIVYVQMPEVGIDMKTGDETAVIESVKAASDVYMPVSGRIVAVNEALEALPQTINSDPYGEGWLYRLKPTDPEELQSLRDSRQYAELCELEDQGD